jgi:hypothetical protein
MNITPMQAWELAHAALTGPGIGKNGTATDNGGPNSAGPKLLPKKGSGDARDNSAALRRRTQP